MDTPNFQDLGWGGGRAGRQLPVVPTRCHCDIHRSYLYIACRAGGSLLFPLHLWSTGMLAQKPVVPSPDAPAIISPQSSWREQHLCPLLVAFSLRTHLSPSLILTCFPSLTFSSSSPQAGREILFESGERERNRREGFCKTKPDLSLSYFSSIPVTNLPRDHEDRADFLTSLNRRKEKGKNTGGEDYPPTITIFFNGK